MCSVNDGNDIELLEWLGWVVMTNHLKQLVKTTFDWDVSVSVLQLSVVVSETKLQHLRLCLLWCPIKTN